MIPFKNGNLFQYCDSIMLLKAIAKSNGSKGRATIIAIAIVGRAITLEREP